MKKNNVIYNGETFSVFELCNLLGVKRKRVYEFIRYGKLDTISAILKATKDTYKFPPLISSEEEIILLSQETIEENMIINDVICDNFGCPTKLSITEKLCGSKCIKHQ